MLFLKGIWTLQVGLEEQLCCFVDPGLHYVYLLQILVIETMAGPTVNLDPPIKDLIPLVTALLVLVHGEILEVEFNKFRY